MTIKEFISQRLEKRKLELEKMQNDFMIFTQEIRTQSFESNAISKLLAMKDIKTEIAELEFLLSIASVNEE